jgi:PPOX class probable F420-dependent enzyme
LLQSEVRFSPEDRAFLEQARVGRLATASAGGEPHVIPVCFVFDGTAFYSAIDAKPKRVGPLRLRRVQNLQANPRASLLVDHYEEDWSRLRYVLVNGRADVLEAGAEREQALRLLREKYSQYRDISGIGQAPLIRLAPDHVVFWRSATRSIR